MPDMYGGCKCRMRMYVCLHVHTYICIGVLLWPPCSDEARGSKLVLRPFDDPPGVAASVGSIIMRQSSSFPSNIKKRIGCSSTRGAVIVCICSGSHVMAS
jgi:hypothetical protein